MECQNDSVKNNNFSQKLTLEVGQCTLSTNEIGGLPWIQIKQIGQRECHSASLTPRQTARKFHQQINKNCGGEHACPFPLPHQRHLDSFSCVGAGLEPEHLNGLFAPSSSCFLGQHNQFSTSRRAQIRVSGFLTSPCVQKQNPVSVCNVCAPLSFAPQHASKCDVHSELHTAVTKEVLGRDFHLPSVHGANIDVHVSHTHVLPDSHPCLEEDVGQNLLRGGSALLHLSRCVRKQRGGDRTHPDESGNLRTATRSTALAGTSFGEAKFWTNAAEWSTQGPAWQ